MNGTSFDFYLYDGDKVSAKLSDYTEAPVTLRFADKDGTRIGPVYLNLTVGQAEALAGDLLAVLAQVKEGAA